MVGVAYLWLRWVIMAKKMRCTIAGITVLLIKIKGFLKMKSQDFSGLHDHDNGSFRRIACNARINGSFSKKITRLFRIFFCETFPKYNILHSDKICYVGLSFFRCPCRVFLESLVQVAP